MMLLTVMFLGASSKARPLKYASSGARLKDDRVPPEHGVRVYEAAKEGSELWMVEDVEHCGAFTEHRDEYLERVCGYFESRLG